MAEALAIIGLASAIVQFVDFGARVMHQLHKLQDEVSNGPQAYQDIRTRLPLMLDLVKKIRLQIEAGEVDETSQAVMLPVLRSCLSQVQQLEELFIKALPRPGGSSWSRGKKAFIGVIKESEIEKIDLILKTNFDLLVHSGMYHSMTRIERQDHAALQQQMVNVVISQPPAYTPAEYDYKPRSDSVWSQAPSASVFMVPFQRDPKFLERQSIMENIASKFENQRRVALAGLGGVGYVIRFCLYNQLKACQWLKFRMTNIASRKLPSNIVTDSENNIPTRTFSGYTQGVPSDSNKAIRKLREDLLFRAGILAKSTF